MLARDPDSGPGPFVRYALTDLVARAWSVCCGGSVNFDAVDHAKKRYSRMFFCPIPGRSLRIETECFANCFPGLTLDIISIYKD